jgi:Xaa-Pro aminopeptidase
MRDGGRDAVERAMARVESALAGASSDDGVLLVTDGDPLTAERLRRDAALGDSATVTVEGSDGALRVGEPVVVTVARAGDGDPRFLARTFVPDSDGGWVRRAAVAVESAIRTATDRLEPGVTPDAVRQELVAEVAAFGFEPDVAGRDTRVLAPGDGEWVEPSADDALDPGDVLALVPAVADPDRGTVLVGDTVRVTDDGCGILTTVSRSVVPQAQDE